MAKNSWQPGRYDVLEPEPVHEPSQPDTATWAPRIVAPIARDEGVDRAMLLARCGELARVDTLAIIAGSVTTAPRAGEIAAVFGGHLVIAIAGDERRAAARARELVSNECGAGLAVAPFDGVEPRALIESARAACDRAGGGTVLRAADAVEQIALGNRVALVADASTARAYGLARRLATAAVPVTIGGPTGSGKDLVAAAIHRFSPRANQPFVALNCAAIPDGLAEAELFGHARGAFTGAVAPRAGLIEASSGGTLFLDEIAELSPGCQARLLRVLEAGEVQRIGETTPRPIELRVIAATHRDLAEEVAEGRFREDLWYRLGVARIDLAPLCERPRDLAALVRRFALEARERSGQPALQLAAPTARVLFAHAWPGNVRELRHVLEFATAAAAITGEATMLPAHLPALRRQTARSNVRAGGGPSIGAEIQDLERRRMIEALGACRGVRNKAAALIQMPLRSFVTKLKRYGITERDWLGTR